MLPDGLAEIVLSAKTPGTPFVLQFAHPSHPFGIAYDGNAVELTGDWPKARARGISCRFETQSLQHIRVFLDVGLVEIFVDGGLACGTKRLDSEEPVTSMTLEAAPDAFESFEIWCLRPRLGRTPHPR
jgi:beta-fructofuranosidase